MEVWVSAKPYMLYEAVELLYAYVNEIPAGSLTQEGGVLPDGGGGAADDGCGLCGGFPG